MRANGVMKIQNQIILVVFFAVYLVTVLLTSFSLVGFWTDVVFSILLPVITLRNVFKNKIVENWLTLTLKTITVGLSMILFIILVYSFTNIFIGDTFKMRSFYYQKVDGRLFNAYFKPVGAYSGGQGNFWITESPVYFPFIEKRVYYERSVHHDFNDDTFDGEPIDNNEVVKDYIKENVIGKKEK